MTVHNFAELKAARLMEARDLTVNEVYELQRRIFTNLGKPYTAVALGLETAARTQTDNQRAMLFLSVNDPEVEPNLRLEYKSMIHSTLLENEAPRTFATLQFFMDGYDGPAARVATNPSYLLRQLVLQEPRINEWMLDAPSRTVRELYKAGYKMATVAQDGINHIWTMRKGPHYVRFALYGDVLVADRELLNRYIADNVPMGTF
jgi:hypothetical protein